MAIRRRNQRVPKQTVSHSTRRQLSFSLDETLQYRVILENITDGFMALSKKWDFIYINRQAEKLIEVEHDEVLGKNIWKRFPLLKGTKFDLEYHHAMRKSVSVEFEEYSVRLDKWFHAKAYPIKEGLILYFNDITKQKRTEHNLQFLAEASKILSSSLEYKTVLQNIAKLAVPRIADWCAVDLLDANSQIQQVAIAHKDPKKVKWAKALRKKYPPDMNAQTGIPHVLHTGKPEFYPEITDEMLVAAAKMRGKEYLELLRNVGFTSAMVVPIFSKKRPIGGITFVTTETRRNYDEADLLMAQELAVRASVAIENALLYKGSQEAITLRDDFISVASHELKTPITSVKMFTQVLKQHSEQIGDDKAVSHLTKMDKQLNKLTELIYDLLDISKIRAGRMEFREKVFDFDKIVKEIIDVLQQSATKHKIIINGLTKKKIYGDEERISQVINNLVSNAIKYSPKADKVLVTLSSDSRQVNVAVQDFGIGMNKEHFGHIFERFYRVYDTTDKTFPGLGIGLYISSEIIKRHGGKLWVDSKVGKGSTFHFSLPAGRLRAKASATERRQGLPVRRGKSHKK